MTEAAADLEWLKALAMLRGYRFETDRDGTERMIRPDGSVAIIARKRKEPA
jgi:hypothetical protein